MARPLIKEITGGAMPVVTHAAGGLCLQLLPGAPYSARDPVQSQSMGVSLQRQRGVHAIGSDRRVDFDTWPGVLACTPAGIDVFSESAQGGEYLVLRWRGAALTDVPEADVHGRRVEMAGHRQALALALRLRRLMLATEADPLALEHAALVLLSLRQVYHETPRRTARADMARVLERIACQFGQGLALEQLAADEGLPVLRFLRDFSRATGMTPHAYIVETRMQAARSMLLEADRPLADIACACGFAHQSHMGSVMRAALGMTPTQYRQLSGT
ncbi:helix-turn-helix transcriptional regulator [Janthinobacterium lividum]|jgi:AraC family transcriptional regulator|nr:AraC family transcriptional regulator [Janthinobacterium lividum]